MLFLLNLIAVFFSWTFFILVYFAIDWMKPIGELEILYQNKDQAIIATLLFFILLLVSLCWTYWDAYIRLSKPDRHPKGMQSMASTHNEPEKSKTQRGSGGKKPLMVSTHLESEEPKQPQKQEPQAEEPKQEPKPTTKRKRGGRKPGSKNKPKEQVQPQEVVV
jgi:outer membrane biosynthesis protein TonB